MCTYVKYMLNPSKQCIKNIHNIFIVLFSLISDWLLIISILKFSTLLKTSKSRWTLYNKKSSLDELIIIFVLKFTLLYIVVFILLFLISEWKINLNQKIF